VVLTGSSLGLEGILCPFSAELSMRGSRGCGSAGPRRGTVGGRRRRGPVTAREAGGFSESSAVGKGQKDRWKSGQERIIEGEQNLKQKRGMNVNHTLRYENLTVIIRSRGRWLRGHDTNQGGPGGGILLFL